MASGFNFFGIKSGATFDIGLMILTVVLVLTIITLLMFLARYYLKFRAFKVVIWKQDAAGNIQLDYDRAGIFTNKRTNAKKFWLQKNKVGLDCDKVPFIRDHKNKRVVYLLQGGTKNFKFIVPTFAKDDILYFDVTEQNVNWAIDAFKMAEATFNNKGLLDYMPYIITGIAIVCIMILMIYVLQNFKIVAEVATSMEHAASTMASIYNQSQTYNGTLVIT